MSRGGVHTFYLIVRREFLTRVRSRFFLVGTAVLMVLLAGYIVIQALVSIFALNALAARIYSNSVLRVGSRVKLADAWRGRA